MGASGRRACLIPFSVRPRRVAQGCTAFGGRNERAAREVQTGGGRFDGRDAPLSPHPRKVARWLRRSEAWRANPLHGGRNRAARTVWTARLLAGSDGRWRALADERSLPMGRRGCK